MSYLRAFPNLERVRSSEPVAESVPLGFKRPAVRSWADLGPRARSVKGVSASFLTPLAGPRKKAEGSGPIQQDLGQVSARGIVLKKLCCSRRWRVAVQVEPNSSSIAAAGMTVTKMYS
jgi:hypothetical protein